MKPVVIVAWRRAEYNPDKNKSTIDFLFPKQTGGKGEAGEVIMINGEVPHVIVKAPEAVQIETERRERGGGE